MGPNSASSYNVLCHHLWWAEVLCSSLLNSGSVVSSGLEGFSIHWLQPECAGDKMQSYDCVFIRILSMVGLK